MEDKERNTYANRREVAIDPLAVDVFGILSDPVRAEFVFGALFDGFVGASGRVLRCVNGVCEAEAAVNVVVDPVQTL